MKRWYHEKSDLDLAYAMTKYQSRDGWSHGDLIRLLHLKPVTDGQDLLFEHALEREAGAMPPREAA